MNCALRFVCVLLLFSAVLGAQTGHPLAEYAFSDGASTGRFGAGLQLAGGARGVTLAASGLSSAFTFESWINPTSYIWSDFWKQLPDGPGNPIYTLSLTWGGGLYFSAYQGAAGTNYPLFTVQTVPLNAWTHVAVTYDGAEIRIYFNAVEVARRSAGGNLIATSQPTEVGADFHGRIDEVRIYTRALSAAEIALDRATPIDPSTPRQVSVVTPADRSLGVSATPISATFSAPVDPATINTSTFSLRDAEGTMVPASVAYDVATRTALLTPSVPLDPLADYTARVGEGDFDTSWTFRTASPASEPRVSLAFSDSGGMGADASGNGNIAAPGHGAHSAAGIFGNGVEFDGVDDDVQIAASDTTSMTGAFSFEAWVRPAGYTWGDLWSRYPDNAVGTSYLIDFAITSAGTLFTSVVLGGSYYPMFTTVMLPLNAWTHVALTYDGARLRIYVDGLEVASRPAHGWLAATPEPMEVGQWFHGALDEVRIYDRALSSAELLADRQTPVDPAPPLFITSMSPGDGALGVPAQPVSAVFSADIDIATLGAGSFELRDGAGVAVPADIRYDARTRTAVLTPLIPLDPLADFTAHVASTTTSTGGSRLAEDVAWSFRTAAAPAAPGAAFAFSEITGTVAEDWSGNGNRAVMQQGVDRAAGWFGGGVSMAGGGAGVLVPAAASMAMTDAFTFESWVQLSGGDRPIFFAHRPDDQGAPLLVWLQSIGGALDFGARLDEIDVPLRTAPLIPVGQWTHVAATYDGANVRLYINGAEAAARRASGSLAPSNQPFEIGRWTTGRMDEVRIYRRALSAGEVAVDMATPVDTSHPPPLIASISPSSGVVGELVTIAGRHFGPVQPSSIVTFSSYAAVVDSWADASIVAVVPPGVPSGPVVVRVNGVASNSVPFTMVVPPVITAIAPQAGPAGQVVVISGTHFGATQANGGVTFNGAAAAVTSWSDTSISAVVPAAAASGPVVVSVSGHASNGRGFTVNGPRINATLSPPPNTFGWNNSSVTVTFACTRTDVPVVFCSSPQTIAFSGAAIKVTGRATDQNGVTATMTALVNVDLTGPAVSVYSPKASAVFPLGTSSVLLKGSAVDALSGTSVVTCAGQPAAIVEQNFSCPVAVQDGTNVVAVATTDAAGQTTAKNVSLVVADVAPASVVVSPATLTVFAGDVQPLAITDDRGRAVSGGTWTSSDPAIAGVSVDAGVSTVHALAAGAAALTFTRGGLSAQTSVTVLDADATPPAGTTLWGLTALANPQPLLTPGTREVIKAVPNVAAGALAPSLFFVERGPYILNRDTTALPTTVRAVSADGRELWTYTLPPDTTFGGYRPVRQIVPDDRGGIILLVSSSRPACCYQMNEVIRRIDGPSGEISWEYTHPETFGRFSEIALHPGGTAFVVEKLSNANTTELVGIDVTLGAVVSRFDLSVGHFAYPNATNATSPLVQDDGSIMAIVSHMDNVNLPTSSPRTAYRVTVPSATAITMTAESLTLSNGSAAAFGVGDILSGPWPDGSGGFVIGGVTALSTSGLASLVHIGANLVASPAVELPFSTQYARDLQYVLGEDAAYVLVQYWEGSGTAGAKLYRIHPDTLGIIDVFDLTGGPNVQLTSAVAGGGTLLTNHALNDTFEVGYSLHARWVSNAPVVQTGATSGTAETDWPFRRGVKGRHHVVNPKFGISMKAQFVVPPVFHTSLRVIPRNQRLWAGQPGFLEDATGAWFLTIGAESSSRDCGGDLVSDVNRSSDLNPDIALYREPLSYPADQEDEIIRGLLLADVNYSDDLPYACRPSLNDLSYNSNSYSHGLLDAVGIASPLAPSLLPYLHWGWRKPVPVEEFSTR